MEDLILKEKELRKNISEAINNANLPAIIIKPILKDFFEQVSLLEQQQYEQAVKSKEKSEELENRKKDLGG